MSLKQTTKADQHIDGDPWGESAVLAAIQGALNDVPGVLGSARLMSHFGEHALGWLSLAALGYAVDAQRRPQWAMMGAAAFSSHAASVVVKRIIRRPRPHHPMVRTGVGNPKQAELSLLARYLDDGGIGGVAAVFGLVPPQLRWAPKLGIPAIMLSRLVLGVHYPTDVTVGAMLGAGSAVAVEKLGQQVLAGRAQTERNAE